MENTILERLHILIDEAGGKENFIEKFDDIDIVPNANINEPLLDSWLNGNAEPKLYNAYLIAKVFHVSMDWLLGLTGKRGRTIIFKRPVTYGDVLIFLCNLFEIGTAEIGNTKRCIIEDEIYASDGLILPKHIMINDNILRKLIEKLIDARSLSRNDFIDSLDKISSPQADELLQYYYNSRSYKRKKPESSGYTGSGIPEKALDYDSLMEIIAEQLKKLPNGMSGRAYAKKIGFPNNTLNGWIKKENLPSIDNLCLLSSKCGKSIDWLLGMDEIANRNKFYRGEWYTYGSVYYILGHLIAKGTIGFVYELESDDENTYELNDLFSINDGFLYCLLLRMESLYRNADLAPEGRLEQLFEMHKDTPLLSFNINNKNLGSDISKILCDMKMDGRYRDIDLDKLYQNLQVLS